ncbi:MAG TPA: hypothetical protein PLQ10_00060 [Ilumatobacteraceae bacterium]|nr:hypothetical protein [Ilumatobacteraceae bacterium]HRC47816.1 hypothetical protein [Ilumatobacteraceae bacterium]
MAHPSKLGLFAVVEREIRLVEDQRLAARLQQPDRDRRSGASSKDEMGIRRQLGAELRDDHDRRGSVDHVQVVEHQRDMLGCPRPDQVHDVLDRRLGHLVVGNATRCGKRCSETDQEMLRLSIGLDELQPHIRSEWIEQVLRDCVGEQRRLSETCSGT